VQKLLSISLGDNCGEVIAQANIIKGTVKFIAKVNGKTIAQGPVYEDIRNLIVDMFTRKEGTH
jgi:hypothetical protein